MTDGTWWNHIRAKRFVKWAPGRHWTTDPLTLRVIQAGFSGEFPMRNLACMELALRKEPDEVSGLSRHFHSFFTFFTCHISIVLGGPCCTLTRSPDLVRLHTLCRTKKRRKTWRINIDHSSLVPLLYSSLMWMFAYFCLAVSLLDLAQLVKEQHSLVASLPSFVVRYLEKALGSGVSTCTIESFLIFLHAIAKSLVQTCILRRL